MLSEREIISTLEMLRDENLDVRTVTLGVSLFDCAGDDSPRVAERVHNKITSYARDLVAICNDVGDKYGIPVVNKRVSVSPIAALGGPFEAKEFVAIAKALDDAAKEVNIVATESSKASTLLN